MLPKLEAKYLGFYLDGRDADPDDFDPDIDLDMVAQRVIDTGVSPHEALLAAVTDAAKHLDVGSEKQAWIDEHKRDLEGLDPDVAYKHYVQGLIDDCVLETEADDDGGLIPALEAAWEDEDGEVVEKTVPNPEENDDEDEEDDDDEDEEDEPPPRKRRKRS